MKRIDHFMVQRMTVMCEVTEVTPSFQLAPIKMLIGDTIID